MGIIPENVSKFYMTGEPLNLNSIAYVCGKYNVYVKNVEKLAKSSAVAAVHYDKKKDLENLVKDKRLRMRRIFKSVKMTRDQEKKTFKTKDGQKLPVIIGFVSNTMMNLLGILKGKKAEITVKASDSVYQEIFIEAGMKIRDDKNLDATFVPKGNITLNVKRVEYDHNKYYNDKLYFITWVEGKGFSN